MPITPLSSEIPVKGLPNGLRFPGDFCLGHQATEAAMTDTVANLIFDLAEWLGQQERTYQEAMEAWRTS